MSGKVRIGIIGAGNISQRHFAGYAQNADKAQMVCVADLNEQAAKEKAEQYEIVDTVTDYKELLKRDDIDAVSICTPTQFHPVIAKEAIESGKHVLSEKPAGLDVQAVRDAIAAAKAAGKVYAIGFMERRFDTFAPLCDAVQAGTIGRPILARACAFNGMSEFTQWIDAEINGGPFIDQFCHTIDTWCTLLDARVTEVAANGFTMSEIRFDIPDGRKPALDTGDALLKFDSGDLGVLSGSWGLPKLDQLKLLRNTLGDSMIGPKGFIIGNLRNGVIVVTEQGETKITNPDFKERYQIAFSRQIREFCAAITNGGQPAASIEAGLHVLQVSLAVLTSMREGRVVRVEEI
ncbi:MAG: Gfo/Idh/MocA family oxidoreductase [Kiritimatiellae bacterium]|nr:Gfo/Idh/MocA family oxidoreductase [Kiritimatiellia bacterium]